MGGAHGCWIANHDAAVVCGMHASHAALLSCAVSRCTLALLHSFGSLVLRSLARRLAWSMAPSVFHQADTGCFGLAVGIVDGVDTEPGMASIDAWAVLLTRRGRSEAPGLQLRVCLSLDFRGCGAAACQRPAAGNGAHKSAASRASPPPGATSHQLRSHTTPPHLL